MKPASLNVLTLILCIYNCYGIAGLFFLNVEADIFKVYAAVAVIVVIISFIVLWFFRKGKDWARILVLVASVLCFFNIFKFMLYPMFTKIFTGSQMLLAVYLLYWLNTVEAKDYFKGE